MDDTGELEFVCLAATSALGLEAWRLSVEAALQVVHFVLKRPIK